MQKICVKNWGFCYPNSQTPVLSNVSFSVEPGAFVLLCGDSGSGKSTLLRLLMGLEKPDSGEVRLPHGTRFSAVFQEDRLLEQMSACANVRLVSRAAAAQTEKLLLQLGI